MQISCFCNQLDKTKNKFLAHELIHSTHIAWELYRDTISLFLWMSLHNGYNGYNIGYNHRNCRKKKRISTCFLVIYWYEEEFFFGIRTPLGINEPVEHYLVCNPSFMCSSWQELETWRKEKISSFQPLWYINLQSQLLLLDLSIVTSREI